MEAHTLLERLSGQLLGDWEGVQNSAKDSGPESNDLEFTASYLWPHSGFMRLHATAKAVRRDGQLTLHGRFTVYGSHISQESHWLPGDAIPNGFVISGQLDNGLLHGLVVARATDCNWVRYTEYHKGAKHGTEIVTEDGSVTHLHTFKDGLKTGVRLQWWPCGRLKKYRDASGGLVRLDADGQVLVNLKDAQALAREYAPAVASLTALLDRYAPSAPAQGPPAPCTP